MTTNNFIELVAQKLSLTDEAKNGLIKSLESIKDLPTIADDAFSKVLSEFEAKNSKTLRALYAKEVYDAVDAKLAPVLAKLGADDKTVGGIPNMKLDEKFGLIEGLVKSQPKPEDKSKPDDKTNQLFEQIKKLEAEKVALETKAKEIEQSFNSQLNGFKQEASLSRLINQYNIDKAKYPNDGIRESLAIQLLSTEAQKRGGKISLADTGELAIIDKDGQGVMNEKKTAFLTVKELADKAFAEANMLVVNPTTKPNTPLPTSGSTQPPDLRSAKYSQTFSESAKHFQNI